MMYYFLWEIKKWGKMERNGDKPLVFLECVRA